MPWNLKRYYGQGDLHFITNTCYHRLPLLASAHARNVFATIFGEVRGAYGFLLIGYVVMPDHIHLLISEPAIGTPSTVMQVLKQRVSRRLRAKWRRRPPRSSGWYLANRTKCRGNSGSAGFTISTCGVRRNTTRNLTTCT